MLDSNIKVEKKEKAEYPPLPENIYQVQLLDVNSEERATYDTRLKAENERELETVMSFQFTLLSGTDTTLPEDNQDLRGRNVWQNFVPTYLYVGKKGKNNLYKIIESLIGRDLNPQEEAEGIDGEFLNELIGKQCRIGLKHKPSKDGSVIYDDIETYYAVETLLPILTEEEKETASVKKTEEAEGVEGAEGEQVNPEDSPAF